MTQSGKQSPDERRRYPVLAGALSLIIPGLGQIYVSERYRGIAILISTIITIGTAFWYNVPIWYLAPAVVWLWNIWDAISLAKGRRRSISIMLAAILIMGYGIGWQVTQINPSALTKNLDRAISIIKPMFRPDFVSRKVASTSGWSPVEVPCGPNPPKAENTANGITVKVSSDCAILNEMLTVQASGLSPDTPTLLYWSNPIGDKLPLGEGHATPLYINADNQGNIITVIQVPPTALSAAPDPTLPLEHRVNLVQTRTLPGYQLSKNGVYLLQGIIETIFLALMSTTFGALIAIPVGFLAARNLMSGNAFTLSIYFIIRTILNIVRSIEPLIIAIVFVVIVGLGPFPGVIA
ncbi:MAG TPA: hypothetical protein VF831_11510, partial [Anaerolineales bacterium]